MRATVLAIVLLSAVAAAHGQTGTETTDAGSYYLMRMSYDQVPPLVERPSDEAILESIARAREYEQQIRLIQKRHFGAVRSKTLREKGLEELREFTDPAAFKPMWSILREERDDVRLAVLDHFAAQGEDGQGALAWVAIQETSEAEAAAAIRYEALKRLIGPASDPVLAELDDSLRSSNHMIANNAATVAGTLNALDTIPLLILAQSASGGGGGDGDPRTGDLAWIAIAKQTVYVRELIPIVNNGAVAFQPVPGVLTEGGVLRVVDAVVVIYRTIIHRVLVSMTSNEWGQSTSSFGYDPARWISWYENEYQPYLAGKQAITPPDRDGG